MRELYPGQPYKIIVDDNNQINSFAYWIDDDYILYIKRVDSDFHAEKVAIKYEKRIHHIGGVIREILYHQFLWRIVEQH